MCLAFSLGGMHAAWALSQGIGRSALALYAGMGGVGLGLTLLALVRLA